VSTAPPTIPGRGAPIGAAPVRDRATWIVYASLAIYGYALYGLGPALDALRGELEISRAAIGLAGSAFAVGAVVAALGAPPVLLRVGHGTILRTGLLGLGAGTVMLVVAGPLPTVIAATFVMGLGGTAVLVVVPLVVEARQPAARAAALAEANMGAAAAGVLAPVAVGAAILAGAGWRAAALLVLAAIAAVILLGAAGDFDGPLPRDARPAAAGPLPPAFWRWWTVIVLVVGVEFCVAFWATDFLQEETGISRGAASASLGLFVGGMAAGRLIGGRLAVARDPRRLLVGALGLAAAGFALFWSTGAAAVSLAGLAVIGLGVAMLFPLSLTFAMASAPGVSEKASARASLAGGIAVLLAPYALATLADAIGVRAGFLLVPVLIAVAVVLVLRGSTDARASVARVA